MFVTLGSERALAGGNPKEASQGNEATTTTSPALPITAIRPEIASEDLALLMKYARRSFRDKLLGRPDRPARYRPLGLSDKKGIVHLTLRSQGTSLVESESPEMGIVDAAVAGGALLGDAALKLDRVFENGGDDLGLEFEWLGPVDYIQAPSFREAGQWTDELLHAFEPAAEGIGVEFRGRRAWTRPSEIIEFAYTPDLALKAAESGVDLRHAEKLRFADDIRYFRFWTYHLWQPTSREESFHLLRGDTLVPGDTIQQDALDAAIERMGRYLHRRRRGNGSFAPEYLPGADRYIESNAARIQLRALRGLAALAAWTHDEVVLADVTKSFDSFAAYLKPMEPTQPTGHAEPQSQPSGLMLDIPGHQDEVEFSAHLLSALSDISWRNAFQHQREGLVLGLLAVLQGNDPSNQAPEKGEAKERSIDDLAKGWALLALAEANADKSDQLIERAIRRSLSFYRDRNAQLGPVARAAMARSLALLYVTTNDASLSDLVFEVLDDLLRVQLNETNCPYPELWGAINVRRPGLIGADSAIYLAALADATALAARIGDQPRRERYRAATLAAVRFVVQLEVRRPGCYYVRSPRDALGGVRSAPWNPRLRADHCANALEALIRARLALFGPANQD